MRDSFDSAVVVYKDDAGNSCYKVVSLKMAVKALDFYAGLYSDVHVYKCKVSIDYNCEF